MKSRTKRNFKLVEPLSDAQIGLEARAQVDDHLDIEVWLRLLACSTQIEQSVRQHLRSCFGTTLPRFDYMAQLDRHPEGLSMKALSCHLMVTCGNVTGVTDPLVSEGLVERLSEPGDRRSWRVRLTPKGRAAFAVMAAEHEGWLIELYKGVPLPIKHALYENLGQLRVHLAQRHNEIATKVQERQMTIRRNMP
jgi:DNA-binding MarR family transcriptional regulator